MRIVLLGAPGAGKGVIANFLTKKYNFMHFGVGDYLREECRRGTELGKKIETEMNNGVRISNNLLEQAITPTLTKYKNSRIVIDGYPRSLEQAIHLDSVTAIDAVVHLVVSKDTILNRITHRLVHKPSGRCYNVTGMNQPRVPGLDDITGEPLTRRMDDGNETLLRRLDEWNMMKDKIKSYYGSKCIDFVGDDSNIIFKDIESALLS